MCVAFYLHNLRRTIVSCAAHTARVVFQLKWQRARSNDVSSRSSQTCASVQLLGTTLGNMCVYTETQINTLYIVYTRGARCRGVRTSQSWLFINRTTTRRLTIYVLCFWVRVNVCVYDVCFCAQRCKQICRANILCGTLNPAYRVRKNFTRGFRKSALSYTRLNTKTRGRFATSRSRFLSTLLAHTKNS